MSEAGYDGERCEGCIYFYPGSASQMCTAKGSRDPVVKQYPGPAECGRFVPSLQCRQVRAEEEANRQRDRIATVLERIANHFCLAAEVRIGLAREEDA